MLQKCTCPVRLTPHKALYNSKGVIWYRDLQGVSETEVKSKLASQGVIDVHRMQIRKGEDMVSRNTFFLTFCTNVLRQSIKAG